LYNEFMHAAHMVDPLVASQTPTYRPLPGMPASAQQALDHIMVRRDTIPDLLCEADILWSEPTLLAHGMLGYLSDHMAVRLKLGWSEASPVVGDAMLDAAQTRD
jgi:hypothetical protein